MCRARPHPSRRRPLVFLARRYTLSNVEQASDRLWGAVIFSYLYTLHALYLIKREYENLLVWRQDWLARGDKWHE